MDPIETTDVSKTTIKTSLPYCLYRVDDRFFKINDGFNTKIRFIKVETKPNRRTQSSQNTEFIRDRWGIDAHSDVEIYTDKEFDQEGNDTEKWALEIINDFIKKYRYHDQAAVHLVPLISEDLFSFNVTYGKKARVTISWGGGMAVINPFLIQEVSNKVQETLQNQTETPLWEELVMNAEQYLYQADYRHSILESVIALEIVISEFILKKCKENGASDSDAEKFVKDIGLTGNIKVTLKLFLTSSDLPTEEVFEKCKGGITIRNKIVHDGRKLILEQEARDTLDSNKKLIQFLLPKIK